MIELYFWHVNCVKDYHIAMLFTILYGDYMVLQMISSFFGGPVLNLVRYVHCCESY
jgi:hypothetical protein